jgi:hypothetical protein
MPFILHADRCVTSPKFTPLFNTVLLNVAVAWVEVRNSGFVLGLSNAVDVNCDVSFAWKVRDRDGSRGDK